MTDFLYRPMSSFPGEINKWYMFVCEGWPGSEKNPRKMGYIHPETGHIHLLGASWKPTHWAEIPPFMKAAE